MPRRLIWPFAPGSGPREDRPFEGYQNFVNLRTVVWGVGLVSLLLDLFALANLDFLNVLLLLPSLMFSVSTLVGPFLMRPKPGTRLGCDGLGPETAGLAGSFLFYLLVAWLIAGGGWREWLGVGLFAVCFSRVLLAGLRTWDIPGGSQTGWPAWPGRMVEGGLARVRPSRWPSNVMRLGGGGGKGQGRPPKDGSVGGAQADL